MKRDFIVLGQLVKRGFKIFLKDKAGVFFSLMAPLFVLVLYVLFLRQVQIDSIGTVMEELAVPQSLTDSFVDCWMLSGVISVSCITVSLSATSIMVGDKETNILQDFYASPIKRKVVVLSYYAYNFVVTVALCFLLLAISFVFLAVTGWCLSAVDVLMIIGLTLISIATSSLICTTICSFLHSLTAHSGLVGIMAACSGFLIGAYMPISMFPKFIQYLVLIFPGTYSSALFRYYFLNHTLQAMAEIAPPSAIDKLYEGYSIRLDFFGLQVERGGQWIIMMLIFVAGTLVSLVIQYYKLSHGKRHLHLKETNR